MDTKALRNLLTDMDIPIGINNNDNSIIWKRLENTDDEMGVNTY